MGTFCPLLNYDSANAQLALHNHGVSSLGSMEGHVLPSIDAVLRTIAAVTGIATPAPFSSEPFLQVPECLGLHAAPFVT
jgi:hypothetical protein